MDFSKFLYLINRKELYFSRADCFDDKFEGYYTRLLYEISKGISIEANGESSNKGLYEYTKTIRESAYVSCWMRSQHESMAHWEIYGGKNSVAILTTVGKLKAQLNQGDAKKDIYSLLDKEIDVIEYIDHHSIDNELAKHLLLNPKNPLKKKNMAFKFEEEVRVIYSHLHHPLARNDFTKNLGKGFGIRINPNELIDRIVISPKADDWFFKLVRDLMKDCNGAGLVEWSKLRVTPFSEVFTE